MPEQAQSQSNATFSCGACGRSFRWSPKLAGKHARCKCGESIAVPVRAPAARPSAQTSHAAPTQHAPPPPAQRRHAAPPPPPTQRAAPPQAPAAPADDTYELDDPTHAFAAPQPRPCTACGAPIPPRAQACQACGALPFLDEQPVRSSSSETRESRKWAKTVALGLRLMLFAIIVGLLSGALLKVAEEQRGSTEDAIRMIGALAYLAAGVMSLIGLFMCLATPRDTTARGFIITSIVLQIAGGVLPVVGAAAGSIVVLIIAAICGFVGFLCFLMFMRELGELIENESVSKVAREAMTLVGVFAGTAALVGAVAFFVVSAREAGGKPDGAGGMLLLVLMVVLLVVGLWFAVKFIQMLLGGATALDLYAGLARPRGRGRRR